MEDIKINESDGKITHSVTTIHNEDTLVEQYQREFMAFRIQEEKLKQLPAVIASGEMGMQLTNRQLEINNEKEKNITAIFRDSGKNLTEEIRKVKEQYTDEKLLIHAEKIIRETKSEIIKEGFNFIFKTEITQTPEDMLIELMTLQNRKVDLLQSLMKQEAQLKKMRGSKEDMEKSMKEIQERMRTTKIFFATRHKNIDDLLDAKSKGRTQKQKTAQTVGEK